MAYGISNVTTPQQKALDNKSNPNPLNLSMMGNPNTVQPIGVSVQSKTGGSTTPSGLSMNPISPTSGIVNPQKLPVATAQPYVSSSTNNGLNLGNALTPQQMASQNTTGTGAGSIDPTLNQNQQQNGLPQNQSSAQTQQYSASNPPTYSGLVGQLANTSSQPSAGFMGQISEANKYNELMKKSRFDQAQSIANIEGSPHTMNFAQGAENVIRNQYLAEQNALGSAFQGASNLASAENTQQGLQQSGLSSAAGLAAPQLAGYNQQAFNPLTQKFAGGGSLNDAVSGIAAKVKNGTMTYADAQSALSGYGQGGTNALQQALGSDFNVAQSNSLAGQQGTIKPAYDYAKVALGNLQTAVQGLNTTQNTNIPIINSITQGLSSTFGVGSEAVQNYKAAIAEARSAIQKVLASVQGGTPTDYVGQSNALLPDNATPNQISAAVNTLDTLGAAKVGIYGNPGISGNTSGAQSSSTGGIQTKYGTINPEL